MRTILPLFFLFLLAACAKEPLLASSRSAEEASQECRRRIESKDHDEAIECFELLKSRFAGSVAALEADLEIGDSYFRKGEFLLAAETYLAFAKWHPTHEKVGYAYYRAGLSHLRESPKAIDRDQRYLAEALHHLETAIDNTTGELNDLAREKHKEARARIARRHFYVGRFYYRTSEYLSAIPRFQELLTHFNGLGWDEEALYLLGDSYRRLANKEKALEILGVFDQHFPASTYRRKLARGIGVR